MLLQKALSFSIPALIGATAALLTVHLTSRPTVSTTRTDVELEPTDGTPRDPAIDRQIAGLERRFRMLESAWAQPVATPEPPPEDLPAGYRTYEEELATVTEGLRERIAAFHREPVNASWSADARLAIIDGAQAALEGLDATLFDVECRSETCMFDVEGAESADLMPAIERLLVYDFGLHCASTATLIQEGGDLEAARFVLDCGADVRHFD